MAKLEIACFYPESAYIAEQNGADRIEMCDGWDLGGTTPDQKVLEKLVSELSIDITVMIRPRGGGFLYTEEEIEKMYKTIEEYRSYPIQGFVFGILKEDGSLDQHRCQELITLAGNIPCVLHRAFDKTPDPKIALEQAISCGFGTILTSGHKTNVMDGRTNLANLVAWSQNRIEIMPGGGLRSSNIQNIQAETRAPYFHSSAIVDASGIANPQEIQLLIKNLER